MWILCIIAYWAENLCYKQRISRQGCFFIYILEFTGCIIGLALPFVVYGSEWI